MNKVIALIVYVDNIVLTGNDPAEMEKLKWRLAKEFEIKDLGKLKYFPRIEVAHSIEGIVISQQKYTLDLLKEIGMSGCKPVETPIEQSHKLNEGKGRTPVNKERYQHLVGKLIYLAHTKHNIAYAVNVVSQFMHDPREVHMEAIFRVLKYLKSSPGQGIHFKRGGYYLGQ